MKKSGICPKCGSTAIINPSKRPMLAKWKEEFDKQVEEVEVRC